MDERPSWADRQMQKLLENPKAEERMGRSAFGRSMLSWARRAVEDWEPDLQEGERVEESIRAERVRLLFAPTPGRIFVTNRRLLFQPIMRMPWFYSGAMELPRDERVAIRSGKFFWRGVYMTPFFLAGHLPGWLHITNLKIKRNREVAWFYVGKPREFAERITQRAL